MPRPRGGPGHPWTLGCPCATMRYVVLLMLACAAVLAVVAFIVAAYRRRWAWTGFVTAPTADEPNRRASKSLWDWLQLLIVPLALALAAFALNAAQDSRDRQREDQRAARELASSDDRTREDALRSYLQQMSDLITDHALRSRPAVLDRTTDAQALARTSTLIVLRRLDGERRGLVVQFLFEAGLITATRHWEPIKASECARLDRRSCWRPIALELSRPRVRLDGADLEGAVLRGQTFVSRFGRCRTCAGGPVGTIAAADLSGADLRDADLSGIDGRGVDFDGADLRGARLSQATLAGSTFDGACVSSTHFDQVGFSTDQSWPSAPGAVYFGAAEGQHVDLRRANLNAVDLRDAVLTDVDLEGAFMKNAAFPHGWTKTGRRVDRGSPICENFSR